MLELPYTARNELRGLLRRYLRLAGAPCGSRWLTCADFLELARFTVEGYAPGPLPPPPGAAQQDALCERLRRAWPEADASMAPTLRHIAAVLDLRYTAAGAAVVRPRQPLLLLHNSDTVAAALREILAGERLGYDSTQRSPNIWTCFGQSTPASAAARAKHLLRHMYPLGELYRLYEHPREDAVAVLAALLRQEEPGAPVMLSEAEARERARRWVGLFGGEARLLASTPDPAQPLRGSFSCQGYIGNAAAVIGMSPDRIGIFMRQWGGMAD